MVRDPVKVEETATLMRVVFINAVQMDLELLEDFKKDYKENLSTYEAVGFMEGFDYLKKLDKHRAMYKRLEKLMEFIQVLKETNEFVEDVFDDDISVKNLFDKLQK